MDRLGRGVRWVYFEKIDIRCIRNHYAALISSMIAKWLNFILRHATHKVTVCADLMESNERLNIGKEQELIQLEQNRNPVMQCDQGSNCHFIFLQKRVHFASTRRVV